MDSSRRRDPIVDFDLLLCRFALFDCDSCEICSQFSVFDALLGIGALL